jgi:hypothetical protein
MIHVLGQFWQGIAAQYIDFCEAGYMNAVGYQSLIVRNCSCKSG